MEERTKFHVGRNVHKASTSAASPCGNFHGDGAKVSCEEAARREGQELAGTVS